MTPPMFKSKTPTRVNLVNIALAAASLLVCLVILELVAAAIETKSFYRWEDRLMFFTSPPMSLAIRLVPGRLRRGEVVVGFRAIRAVVAG